MILDHLVNSILSVNTALRESAAKAINKCVTARNWLIGYYIVHYEQNGEDRAEYGERILQSLAERLGEASSFYPIHQLGNHWFPNCKAMKTN